MKKHIHPIYLFVFTTVISVVSYFLSFTPFYNGFVGWIFDLLSHWQFLYFILGCLFFVLCIKKYAELSIICMISIFLVCLSSYHTPAHLAKTVKTPLEKPLKIVSSNVLFTTKNLDYLKSIIDKEQPDIIYLIEVNQQHMSSLENIAKEDRYYLFSNPHNSPFGYAVLSKEKIAFEKKNMPEEFLYFQKEGLCGALVHLMPPISQAGKEIRDNTVSQLINTMNNCEEKTAFIAGDFNATPWSSPLLRLKQQGFHTGSHVLPTWPTFFYKWIGIPIDHILIKNNHSFSRYEVINPENNSDHYALIAEIK